MGNCGAWTSADERLRRLATSDLTPSVPNRAIPTPAVINPTIINSFNADWGGRWQFLPLSCRRPCVGSWPNSCTDNRHDGTKTCGPDRQSRNFSIPTPTLINYQSHNVPPHSQPAAQPLPCAEERQPSRVVFRVKREMAGVVMGRPRWRRGFSRPPAKMNHC